MVYWTKLRILNRRILNDQKILKDIFNFLSYEGMQTTRTLRYHLIHVRMAKIKNTNYSSCWSKDNIYSLLVVMQTCATSLKINVVVSQKIGSQHTSGSSNITLGNIPKNVQSYYKSICSTMFVAALFVISWPGNNLDVPQLKNG